MSAAADIHRQSRDEALRSLEALARSSSGGEIFQGCLAALDHGDWGIRHRAAQILRRFSQKAEVVEALKNAYPNGSVDQRYWIMKILAQVRGAEALPWIRKTYGQARDPQIRTHAISAAAEVPGAEASEFLVQCLTDDSWLNRQAAASCLEDRGSDVLKFLQKGFAEGSGDMKYWCLRLLVRILGPEAKPTIKKGMQSEDPNIRHYVLRSLEGVDGTWEIPYLVEFLGDANWSNRKVAARLLRAKGRPALKSLAGALRSRERDVRYWALQTLGETADERSVQPLESFLYDTDDEEEAVWALEALGRIPCAAAARTILETSYEHPGQLDRMVEILVSMGAGAIRPLVEYLDSPNDSIRSVCEKVVATLEYPAARSFFAALGDLPDEERDDLLQAMKQVGREQLEALFQRSDLSVDLVREAAARAPPRAFPTMSTVSVNLAGARAQVEASAEELDLLGGSASTDEAARGEAASSGRPSASDYPMDLEAVLTRAVKLQASDIHLKPNLPPIFRIHGNLRQTDLPPLSAAATHAFALAVLPPLQREAFSGGSFEADAAHDAGALGRFRVNCYQELHGTCVALRHIPGNIQTLADLQLPRVFRDLCMTHQGLILVTGPTGSGKSTTLAAMVDYINAHRECHVITIEDPVEFTHRNQMSVITHRELGTNTASYADALRAALREDPDVILVGEMRDQETMHLAITAAETGHLVLSTLHTSSAGESVDRIVNVFPTDHHDLIRTSLAESLRAVVTQLLVPATDGRRAAIREVLLRNAAVANFIREGKLHQVDQAIISGRKEGMQSRDDDLQRLLKEGTISRETAFAHCTDKKVFLQTASGMP